MATTRVMFSATDTVLPMKRRTVGSTCCFVSTRWTARTTREMSHRPTIYSASAPRICRPTLAAFAWMNCPAAVQFIGEPPCPDYYSAGLFAAQNVERVHASGAPGRYPGGDEQHGDEQNSDE